MPHLVSFSQRSCANRRSFEGGYGAGGWFGSSEGVRAEEGAHMQGNRNSDKTSAKSGFAILTMGP